MFNNPYAHYLAKASIVYILLTPYLAQAQLAGGDAGVFGQFVQGVSVLINSFLIPALVALCVLMFIYGVYTYFIVGSADEQKRADGRQFMLYALLGFVAIVTLWAIVQFLAIGFGFSPDQGSLPLPTAGGTSGADTPLPSTGTTGGGPSVGDGTP